MRLTHRLESIISTASFRSLLTQVLYEWITLSVLGCQLLVGRTCWSWWRWAGSGVWTENRRPEEPESEWSSPATPRSSPSPRILQSRDPLPPPSWYLRGRKEGSQVLQTGTRRLLRVLRALATEIHMQTMIRLYLNRGETQWEHSVLFNRRSHLIVCTGSKMKNPFKLVSQVGIMFKGTVRNIST